MSKKIIIPEEEKNRILEMHSILNKNQYLINEQNLSEYPVNNIQTVVIGRSTGNNKHTIIDGTTYNNIVLGFNRESSSSPSGTWYVQNEKYDKEYYGGNWSFDNQTKQYTFSSQDGTLNKSGDFAQWGAFDDLVKFVVNKFQNSQSMGDDSFVADLLKLAKDKNVQIKQDSLLAKQDRERFKYNVPTQQTSPQTITNSSTDDSAKVITPKQTKQKTPYVNKYIEDLKKQLQLPTDTTKQDTLNALMAKLNEIPVKQ